MNPDYSVILFTTASGAGYGLLFWLGLEAVLGRAGGWPALAALGLGLGLVTVGLLSSTFHLGHPERAWRAVSQWRSSWLSREGVAALATYVPAGLLGLGWLLADRVPGEAVLGLLLMAGCVATVVCTGMIYASLRTVPEWNMRLVPGIYLAFAGGTGALLLAMLDAFRRGEGGAMPVLAALLLAAGLALKLLYWRRIDGAALPHDAAEAIGIPGASDIRVLDPPHTRPNFVMREMGFAVARRHARRLRAAAIVLIAAAAFLCLSAAILPGLDPLPLLVAVPLAGLGVWTERWLFFAQARHLSMLYYAPGLGAGQGAGEVPGVLP